MNSSQPGFSLIEILVSIALLSIMSSIGVSLYAIVNNSYSRANSISRIQSQGSSVMEGIERNIRSSINATTSPDYSCPTTITVNGTPATVAQCLSLQMPNDSIEYKNTQCEITEYDWVDKTATTNGRLLRATKLADGTICNGGMPADLFNSDTSKGISVEVVNGQTGVFVATVPSSSPTNVTAAINLLDGVALGGVRSQVPFITTISLRDYSN
jgi:prepilin-type N-terminal cleavage/methylation domain-containing protein